jgi:cobalt-zinc-cadmium efflux system outer membrane protein
MNPFPKSLLSGLLLLSLSAPLSRAESDAIATSALVSETLADNPERAFYEAELIAARAARKSAALLPPPEISGLVGQKRAHDPAGQLAGEGVAWSVGVSQTFEWPGRIGLRKAIANRDVALAELGCARFTNALAARVRSLALGLAGGTEKSRVAGEVADRFRALRDVLVQRDPAGVTPALEIRIVEATELSLRRRAAEAILAAEVARVELNQLRGRPTDAALAVVLEAPQLPPAPELDTLLAAAQTNSFDLRLRAVELEQQGFHIALAKNERWPAFTVGPQFSEENAGGQDRILGLGVSFPLPLWRGNSARVEAAKARQIQAETLLGNARREVERRVVNASRTYAAKLDELNRWRPDSVAQFRGAAELADRHYRLGAVPAATYVELQKQYLDAVEVLLDTRREAVEAAQDLEQVTGIVFLSAPQPEAARP